MIKYTHRTRSGLPARIICKDRTCKDLPVIALVLGPEGEESVAHYTAELKFYSNMAVEHVLDLVEHNPWLYVAVDTPVWVRNSGSFRWLPRHFASFKNGRVSTWGDGNTSHTTNGEVVTWEHATLKLTKQQDD